MHPLSARQLQEQMADVVGDSIRMDVAYDQVPSAQTIDVFYRLVPEELRELAEAMDTFRASCMAGTPDLRKLADMCKEVYDVTTIVISFLHMLGVDINAIWQAGVANNHEKIDPATGKYRKNDKGKIVKPEGWQPLDLSTHLAGDFAAMLDEYRKFGEIKP